MQEYLLLYRREEEGVATEMSPEQLQAMMKPWMDWLGSIAAQDKLVTNGNRLGSQGRVVKPGHLVTDGPYVELKEAVGGYSIVRAASLEEAVEISKGCPILQVGGCVEVRPVI